MKYVTVYDTIYRLSDRKYKQVLQSISAGMGFDVSDCVEVANNPIPILDMTIEEANGRLRDLAVNKALRSLGP